LSENIQHITLITLLIILLATQLYGTLSQKNLKRKYTKLTLNILLWISIVILIFPPTTNNNKYLVKIGIKDEIVSPDFEKKIKDSLGLKMVVSTSKFEKEYADKNQEVKLIGQSFNPEFLSLLSDRKVEFLPELQQNEIQNLKWRAVVFQNETQTVNGLIDLEKTGTLKLKYGSQILDSVKLEKGKQHFNLSYPSFSVGKTNISLNLEEETISEIKYYSRASPKLKILVLAENPDFETKMLSEWLGKNGHTVDVETIITKNTQNKTVINQNKAANYNIVFTTPASANNPVCQKTLKAGGGVFVFNLTEKDLSIVNKSFSENFEIQRISQETESKLPNDLIGIPFGLKENTNQQKFNKWPISVSNKRVGITLISETYPLLLSGDSITYRQIWGNVLQFLQPVQKNNIEIAAPIVCGLWTNIKFNNFDNSSAIFKTTNDTIFTKISPINTKTRMGKYVFRQTDWQKINDSLEVFVEVNAKPYLSFMQTKSIINSYDSKMTADTFQSNSSFEILPDWLRLILCIILFIVVWIEAKW
jgi:hypothetical protein